MLDDVLQIGMYDAACVKDDSDGASTARSGCDSLRTLSLGDDGSRCTTPSDTSSCGKRPVDNRRTAHGLFSIIDIPSSSPLGRFTKAVFKRNGMPCTVKAYPNESEAGERLREQLAITKRFNTVYVHKLQEICFDGAHAYAIGEQCLGGRLADHLKHVNNRLSEVEAARVVRQTLSAVEYMHGNSVCHRDLTVDNLMLATPAALTHNVVKVSGFEHACNFTSFEPMTQQVGYLNVRAPEMIGGAYNNMVDLWSVGIVLHQLLCGCLPFTGVNDVEIQKQIQDGSLSFPAENWQDTSHDAQVLVQQLLEAEPNLRLTAAEALDDQWIVAHRPFAVTEADEEDLAVAFGRDSLNSSLDVGFVREMSDGSDVSVDEFDLQIRKTDCVHLDLGSPKGNADDPQLCIYDGSAPSSPYASTGTRTGEGIDLLNEYAPDFPGRGLPDVRQTSKMRLMHENTFEIGLVTL